MKIHCLRPIAAFALAIALFTSSAQADTNFQYKVVFVQDILPTSNAATQFDKRNAARALETELNRHGSQGWELIQIDGAGYATFKKAQ